MLLVDAINLGLHLGMPALDQDRSSPTSRPERSRIGPSPISLPTLRRRTSKPAHQRCGSSLVALATGHRKSPAHHRESEAGLSLRPHLARVDQPAEVGSTRPLNEAAGGWLHSAGPAAGRSILWREAPKQKPRQRSGAKVGPSFVINRTCRSLRRTASPPPQRRAAPLVAHSAGGEDARKSPAEAGQGSIEGACRLRQRQTTNAIAQSVAPHSHLAPAPPMR
jgi:hypothetical protein